MIILRSTFRDDVPTLDQYGCLDDDEFIEVARSVYKTNDQRAEMKRKINEETNSEYKEIKIY